MACFSPITISNNSKSLPSLPKSSKRTVPCGRCGYCLKKKANDWSFRLTAEEKSCKSAFFITLTYSDKYFFEYGALEDYPSLDHRDVQLFLKRVRKHQIKHKWTLKYYCVGEYGERRGRPHYHLIIFNLQIDTMRRLNEIWKLGDVHIGQVNRKTINYVTYYVFKKMANKDKNLQLGRANEYATSSQNLGIAYIQNKKYHRDNSTFLAFQNGIGVSLPNYYKPKFWNKLELQKIQDKYLVMSDEHYQKEITRLRKTYAEPDNEHFKRRYDLQFQYLTKLKKDKH